MLKTPILHPQILSVLGQAGHGSKILIADGNYPFHTTRGPNAQVVYLNFTPGVLTVTQVLDALLPTVPVEAAAVMEPNRTGPYAMKNDPEVFGDFKAIFKKQKVKVELERLERFAFYHAAQHDSVALVIATAEQRIYANLLLTIGVVM